MEQERAEKAKQDAMKEVCVLLQPLANTRNGALIVLVLARAQTLL